MPMRVGMSIRITIGCCMRLMGGSVTLFIGASNRMVVRGILSG